MEKEIFLKRLKHFFKNIYCYVVEIRQFTFTALWILKLMWNLHRYVWKIWYFNLNGFQFSYTINLNVTFRNQHNWKWTKIITFYEIPHYHAPRKSGRKIKNLFIVQPFNWESQHQEWIRREKEIIIAVWKRMYSICNYFNVNCILTVRLTYLRDR